MMSVMMWTSTASTATESNCSAGQVCLYYNPGYGGGWAKFVGNDYSYKDQTFDGCGQPLHRCDLNDNTSSIDNDGRSCPSYHCKNYIGQTNTSYLKVAQGGYRSSLNRTRNDVLSAHKWCSPA
jgi:hypothetical protein